MPKNINLEVFQYVLLECTLCTSPQKILKILSPFMHLVGG